MSRKRLLVTWVLVIAMTLASVEPLLAEAKLMDYEEHWAAATIAKWIDQGLIKGYGDNTIRPDNPVSAAEFVSMINRVWGISGERNDSVIQDVAKDKWYYSEIAAAYSLGYINMSGAEIIKPDDTVTREQAAVMIAQLLTLESGSQNDGFSKLEDHEQFTAWFRPYVEAVYVCGIMNGYPDQTFRPAKAVTRAEAMTIIDRAVQNTGTIAVFGQAGTYGPEAESAVIDGNVIISSDGVTMQNTVVNGNLLLAASIGEGNVKLKNVSVKGNTIIKGGGPNSITVEDSSLPNVIVDKDGVRIVVAGNTSVKVVQLASGAILVEAEITGSGFETVNIVQEISPGATIRLEGDFTTLTIEAGINNAVVNLGDTSRINTLNVNGSVRINGQGIIETANINADNVVIESTPVTTVVASGLTASVGEKN